MPEKTNVFIETSWGSLNHYGEELCGDKVEVASQADSTLLILSDGLGSGVKANILASLTAKIIAAMLQGGADLKDVVETIASTLPVCRVRQVAYSTFTVIQCGRDGSAYMAEFDNPSLVLLRQGKRAYIPWVEQTLSGKRVREARMQLQLGDCAIAFSDGVIHAGVGRALNLGWQHEAVVKFLEEAYCPGNTAAQLQHKLLAKADALYENQPGDDTTVAVMRLTPPVPCYVMVGPPVNPADDARVAGELLACPGIKVVCGGTTSQIVSRAAGKELAIDLAYFSPDVPPIARMAGIDLATEGVVTLGRTLEILESYLEKRDAAVLSQGRDGAHLLAQALAEKCTSARFLVGRALNPAHQNPDMPISLSIKLRLVKDIAACLQKLGKPVELKYY